MPRRPASTLDRWPRATPHESEGVAGGGARTCTSVTALVDTNVLVYRFDPRDPRKQRIATELLRVGIADGSLRLPHQAIVEFVAATTRRLPDGTRLLEPADARWEAEELLSQFEVLYPDAALVRLALRGAAAYRLSWFDAHLWAYAEHFGLSELLSEDFQHDRVYGSVRVADPFGDE
jgi:predicted nucleic acid-binding protein